MMELFIFNSFNFDNFLDDVSRKWNPSSIRNISVDAQRVDVAQTLGKFMSIHCDARADIFESSVESKNRFTCIYNSPLG